MTGIIIFLIIAVCFYGYIYRNWKNKTKRTFKIVICVISLSFTVMLVFLNVASAGDLYENERARSLSGRMDAVLYDLSKNDYKYTIFNLQYDHDYEEEFEYIWERCEMYMARNRYELYRVAAENDTSYQEKADPWREKLYDLCNNPDYSENRQYGSYFLESVQ